MLLFWRNDWANVRGSHEYIILVEAFALAIAIAFGVCHDGMHNHLHHETTDLGGESKMNITQT